MKIDLHPKIGERERFFVQISEFSFAAYPVQINHVFRSLPEAASFQNRSRTLRWNVLRRRLTQLLRWACGKPAVANLSLKQAVP